MVADPPSMSQTTTLMRPEEGGERLEGTDHTLVGWLGGAPRSGIRVVLIIRTGTSQAVPKGVGGLRGFSYQSWLLRAKGQCGWGHLQINCTLVVQNRQAQIIGRIRV